MAAGTYDIVIDQGSDFAIEIAITGRMVNTQLATHSARAQLASISNLFYKNSGFYLHNRKCFSGQR